jgi:hypothetical protein
MRYKRVSHGPSTWQDTDPDEWTAVRRRPQHRMQSALSESKHRKEKDARRTYKQSGHPKRTYADAPCSHTANQLGSHEPAREQRADSVTATIRKTDRPQLATAVDNSKYRRGTKVHEKNGPAPSTRSLAAINQARSVVRSSATHNQDCRG